MAPRLRRVCLLAMATATIGLCDDAGAQLPATRLTAVFPAGATRGSELDLTIASGTDLEGVNRLWFSHPGLAAVQKTQAVEGQAEPQPVANQFRVTIAGDVPPGVYEIRAVGAYGISNPRAFSVSDRMEVVETEPNQSFQQAQEAPGESWINGRCDPAKDLDCFRFVAKAGQRIIIETRAEAIDSRMDATLELYDGAGRLLELVRDFNHHDPLIDFLVPADGHYVVKIYDSQYRGGADYFYRLGISTAPYVDFVYPPAGLPGAKGTYTVYGRNLPGGSPAGVSLDGQPLEQLQVEVELPGGDEDRQRLAWDGFVEPPSAALDGITYRVTGPSGTSNPALIGYATAPIVLEQEPNDDAPQVVSPPCECIGQFLERGDRDTFSFAGKKDEVFWIEVYSQRLASPTDPTLLVEQVTKNEQGEEIRKELKAEDDSTANVGGQSFNTASGDPMFRLVCPADGEYRVTLRDLYAETRGSPRLFYRLAIRHQQPDFRLVALADFPIGGQQSPNPWTNFLRKGGTDMLRVLALRQDGFAGEIKVHVEGLPEGVSCREATIGPNQPGTMLILTADENAADWVGPIQVIGRAAIGDRQVVRQARPATVIAAVANYRGVSRLARDLALAVGSAAPYLLTATTPEIKALQSQWIVIPLEAVRRGDFAGALGLTAAGIPGGVQNESINLAADQKTALLYLFAQADAPPGTYTIYAQSSTQVPFTKNADGSDKKPLNVVDASTPVDVTIAPGPLVLAPKVPNNGNVKQGATLDVPVAITRRNNFAGPVTLDLFLPQGTVGIHAEPVTVAADQTEGKLSVQAAGDAAEGPRPHVAVRAQVEVDGQKLELHQPIPIIVQK
jgi:hypothetical protein